jgi:predicted nucleotidyltransferase/DNA-binding HxlR family transcriptional regulator
MRTTLPPDSIGAVLFGVTRRAVLSVLFADPDRAVYLRELARMTGTSPGAMQREVRTLAAAGLIERAVRGNQVHYRANRVCPVFEPLHTIVQRTMGIADAVRAGLVPLAGEIAAAYLFGSMAAGTAGPGSDVDVLVIGPVEPGRVSDALAPLEATLDRQVNPVVHSVKDVRRRIRAGNHFLSALLRSPRVQILGSVDELARVARKSVARGASDQPGGDRRAARPRRPRAGGRGH